MVRIQDENARVRRRVPVPGCVAVLRGPHVQWPDVEGDARMDGFRALP